MGLEKLREDLINRQIITWIDPVGNDMEDKMEIVLPETAAEIEAERLKASEREREKEKMKIEREREKEKMKNERESEALEMKNQGNTQGNSFDKDTVQSTAHQVIFSPEIVQTEEVEKFANESDQTLEYGIALPSLGKAISNVCHALSCRSSSEIVPVDTESLIPQSAEKQEPNAESKQLNDKSSVSESMGTGIDANPYTETVVTEKLVRYEGVEEKTHPIDEIESKEGHLRECLKGSPVENTFDEQIKHPEDKAQVSHPESFVKKYAASQLEPFAEQKPNPREETLVSASVIGNAITNLQLESHIGESHVQANLSQTSRTRSQLKQAVQLQQMVIHIKHKLLFFHSPYPPSIYDILDVNLRNLLNGP